MRKLRFGAIWRLAILGMFACQANWAAASTLYDQPWDGNYNLLASQNDTNTYGNFATTYDNFTLAANNSVTGIAWAGGYFNGSQAPIANFVIDFYANNGGAPGALLSSETISGTANENFIGNGVYSYSADISGNPFSAAAGTEYWVSIVPTIGFPPQWGWATGTGGDGSAYQVFFGSGGATGNDMAFSLSGNSSAVPEPSSFALLGFGGIGLAIGAYRRRRAAAV